MSGGVDSSVAAALAAEAGYETIGVTLKLLPGAATGFGCCGAPEDIEDARRVCEKIGIRHYVLNFDDVFERSVIDLFVKDYLHQRTPNPCVECNRSVKFGALLRLATSWNASYVVTGHYARVEHPNNGGVVRMLRSADEEKDQTYFLHSLTQKELERILFPVGHLTKAQVRDKARLLGLKTADKKESQEICFVPNKDYRSFIRDRAGDSEALRAGEVRDVKGNLRGQHEGLAHYTIGQRRGIGVSSERPLYVTKMDGASNTLVVGEEKDTLGQSFRMTQVTWTSQEHPGDRPVGVRIRHRAKIVPGRCVQKGDAFEVYLDAPQRAITPGQTAVFYEGEQVLGGGTIEEVL